MTALSESTLLYPAAVPPMLLLTLLLQDRAPYVSTPEHIRLRISRVVPKWMNLAGARRRSFIRNGRSAFQRAVRASCSSLLNLPSGFSR